MYYPAVAAAGGGLAVGFEETLGCGGAGDAAVGVGEDDDVAAGVGEFGELGGDGGDVGVEVRLGWGGID